MCDRPLEVDSARGHRRAQQGPVYRNSGGIPTAILEILLALLSSLGPAHDARQPGPDAGPEAPGRPAALMDPRPRAFFMDEEHRMGGARDDPDLPVSSQGAAERIGPGR